MNMNDLKLIDTYKSYLQKYSQEHLRHILEQRVCSISQMHVHLTVVAHEYLDSFEACALAVREQK